eukprot:4965793-Prymnesium_polylepis.1
MIAPATTAARNVIMCETPPQDSAGPVSVWVSSYEGVIKSSLTYEFKIEPQIQVIHPSSGPVAG